MNTQLSALESSTVRKVTRRLIPFLFLCFFIAILDRVNISFAALQMNQDLQFSDTVFGLGAGMFFLGYFLLEVPGSAMMAKVGARKWICRIMVSWGLLAVLMAFIKTPWQFYTVRFLLGVAEASFYPCMVHYLSGFYQTKHHAKAIAAFMLAIPVLMRWARPSLPFCSASKAGGWPAGNGCLFSKPCPPWRSASWHFSISMTALPMSNGFVPMKKTG